MLHSVTNTILMMSLLLTSLMISQIQSKLVRGPSDAVVVRDSTVTLPCATNLSRPVMWQLKRFSAPQNWINIYSGNPGSVSTVLKHKYSVSMDPYRNQYNLTIKDIRFVDAGTYRCIDDGAGLSKSVTCLQNQAISAEITVTEKSLKCKIIEYEKINNGTTDDTITDVDINLFCTILYCGNVLPTLHWSVVKTNEIEDILLFQPWGWDGFQNGVGIHKTAFSFAWYRLTDLLDKTYVICHLLTANDHLILEDNSSPTKHSFKAKVYWKSPTVSVTGVEKRKQPTTLYSYYIATYVLVAASILISIYSALITYCYYKAKRVRYRPTYNEVRVVLTNGTEIQNARTQNYWPTHVRASPQRAHGGQEAMKLTSEV